MVMEDMADMGDTVVIRFTADIIIMEVSVTYILVFITVRYLCPTFMVQPTRRYMGTTHLIMGDLFTRTVITTDDIAGDGEGILWKIAQGSFDGKSLFLWINSQRVSGK